MLYIATLLYFLLWAIWVSRKGHFSWHAVISVYVVTLFVVDAGDVPCDFWFNFYDLPVHLLTDLDAGHYLGIILSDGMIFPLVAIIFCYYSTQYHHPWRISMIFAAMLGILEVIYVNLGFMVYHRWNHLITPARVFIALRLLAHFSDRFVNYTPPISYRIRLLCFVYVITEWPGALLAGALRLYQYTPNIFQDETGDDRFVAMILAGIMGVLAAVIIPNLAQRLKLYAFLALGGISTLFAVWMNAEGILIYHQWNHVLTTVRYITPYLFAYLYDRWEWTYTRKFLKGDTGSVI